MGQRGREFRSVQKEGILHNVSQPDSSINIFRVAGGRSIMGFRGGSIKARCSHQRTTLSTFRGCLPRASSHPGLPSRLCLAAVVGIYSQLRDRIWTGRPGCEVVSYLKDGIGIASAGFHKLPYKQLGLQTFSSFCCFGCFTLKMVGRLSSFLLCLLI